MNLRYQACTIYSLCRNSFVQAQLVWISVHVLCIKFRTLFINLTASYSRNSFTTLHSSMSLKVQWNCHEPSPLNNSHFHIIASFQYPQSKILLLICCPMGGCRTAHLWVCIFTGNSISVIGATAWAEGFMDRLCHGFPLVERL